ncbi:Dienelactone hydrolase family protein [Neorhodopirellula lusitana]|uniref:Dienelactone hydrolase family protein n=1 Tax=Neorhodopirellula lusitana TaxID=445327 RepID=A0ABY1PRV9_9BACT|nr:alpha/beta hydrolase [Neorhodopirellula lusitana]SMP43991.1 Dienelactone hydrolase family protein [Neorhodopirellula lusitana]
MFFRSTMTVRVLISLFAGLVCVQLHAEKLIPLRNGLTLRGIYLEVATLNENAFSLGADGGVQNRPIWMVDDGLRRTYIHRRGMVSNEPVDVPDLGLRIELAQPVPDGGDEVGAIGQILGVSPLNAYGRRQMTVRGVDGSPTVVHQGLTELTARYARLEGLKADRSIRLDMRLATQSIDTPALLRIFRKRLDQNDPDERLETVRFFIEAERYGDARRELQAILDQFPEQAELQTQLTALVERQAIQLIDQAKLRRQSGQPQLAETILRQFPLGRVGRVTRLRVEDEIGEISRIREQRDEAISQLKALVKELPDDQQGMVASIIREIEANLSANTLPRLSDFIRAGTNQNIPAHQRIALAIAGWIQGNGSGETNLKLALSVIQVRELVQQYLAHPDGATRDQILARLKPLEAARAETIAQLLPLIPPPLASRVAIGIDRAINPPSADGDEVQPPSINGHPMPIGVTADQEVQDMFHVGPSEEDYFALQADSPMQQFPPAYIVQLPPEYDPLRSYPCVVALHAAGAPAETQLNWWAGVATNQFLQTAAADDGDASEQPQPKSMRLGQAARHGFIVVAPRWTRGGQRAYEYTPREHDAVLSSVRSAMRRFSIDADRIFIAGHGAGGSAAWDISLSHPDIWAGMIAIGAEPTKTLLHYDANAVHMPVYIVMGDKDGRPLKRNGAVYDDYMTYQHDAMFVMYRGRGKEFFYEESDRIFEWMSTSLHNRAKIPAELDLITMRENDRFFWWLEWDQSLPETYMDPILWTKNVKRATISAVIGANNEVRISQAPSNAFTVWLTPEMEVDFGEPIAIRYRSRRADFRFDGEFETMLEDVRRRADRRRPFWGKVTIP